MLSFVLLSLTVWRITALLVYDDGPKDVFVFLRKLSGAIGGPLGCFWCTSVWVSFVASLLYAWTWEPGGWAAMFMWGVWWWALSGVAVIIDELIARNDAQV